MGEGRRLGPHGQKAVGWVSNIETHGDGYISSKNPPPFSFPKTPVNPHGWSWNGCTSMISTSSTSPGWAPSTSKGPLR